MPPLIVTVANAHPVVQFDPASDSTDTSLHPGSNRSLLIHDQRVFDLGVICETCSFLYQRLHTPPRSLTPTLLADLLNHGITTIAPSLIETLTPLLPSGTYHIGLFSESPIFIAQPAGHSSTVGYGEVHTPFYRLPAQHVDAHGLIEQAIVPLFSPTQLDPQRVQFYKQQLQNGQLSTALAISIVEGKHVMGGNSYQAPDCLSVMHFLLDGHHKLAAASQTGQSLSILSFLYRYRWASIVTTHPHEPSLTQVLLERYYGGVPPRDQPKRRRSRAGAAQKNP